MCSKAVCLASGFNAAAGQIDHSKTYCTLSIEGRVLRVEMKYIMPAPLTGKSKDLVKSDCQLHLVRIAGFFQYPRIDPGLHKEQV